MPSSTLFGAKQLEMDKDCIIIEDMQQGYISHVKIDKKGKYLVTCCSGNTDLTVKCWNLESLLTTSVSTASKSALTTSTITGKTISSEKRIQLLLTLVGNMDRILCIELCVEFKIILSGSRDGSVRTFDLITGQMLRVIQHDKPVLSIGMNSISGSIATLCSDKLTLFSINGDTIYEVNYYKWLSLKLIL
jgi:WD40 repeat protein